MKGVLITGANGSVGSRLVAEYLGQDGYHVFALVRGTSQEEAAQRMRQPLEFWGFPPEGLSERLTVLAGDVTQPDFGLDAATATSLKERTQLVIHAASSIKLNLDLEAARATNLQGTKVALAAARDCPGLEMFGYVSTLEIMGDYAGVVYEEFLTDYPRNFLNTYEIAKFEAEEFLRGQLAEGVPITIFRPSMVVGESTSGRALNFQSFYLLLEKLLLTPDSPILPRGCPVNTIPVDVLAMGIRRLMEFPAARGQVYHFAQGLDDLVSFAELLDQVQPIATAQLGKKIRRPTYISPAIVASLLAVLSKITVGSIKRKIDAQRIFIKFLPLQWKIDNKNLVKSFDELGIRLPRFK